MTNNSLPKTAANACASITPSSTPCSPQNLSAPRPASPLPLASAARGTNSNMASRKRKAAATVSDAAASGRDAGDHAADDAGAKATISREARRLLQQARARPLPRVVDTTFDEIHRLHGVSDDVAKGGLLAAAWRRVLHRTIPKSWEFICYRDEENELEILRAGTPLKAPIGTRPARGAHVQLTEHNSLACDLEDGSFRDGALYNGVRYYFWNDDSIFELNTVQIVVRGANALAVCIDWPPYTPIADDEPIAWGPPKGKRVGYAEKWRTVASDADAGG